MNNNYNHADFVGMDLTSDDEFESYGYDSGLQPAYYSLESTVETPIEHILLNHSKYHVYCE